MGEGSVGRLNLGEGPGLDSLVASQGLGSVLLSSGQRASPPHTKAAPFLQALEKHCRTEAGFSGIQDVYSSNPNHDNRQQSFFLAETLK